MSTSSLTCHALVFLFGSPDAVDRAVERLDDMGRADPSMALDGHDLEPLASPFGVEGQTWASRAGAWQWEIPPHVASLDQDRELRLRDRELSKRLPQEETLLVARIISVPEGGVDVRLWGTGQLGQQQPVYLARFDVSVPEPSIENITAVLQSTIQKFGSAKRLVDQALALRRQEVLEKGIPLASPSAKFRL